VEGGDDGLLTLTRGYFSFPPPLAMDMLNHKSTETTGVLLQMTRRRELVKRKRGWGGKTGYQDRNSYRAELPPKMDSNNYTSFFFAENVYPVLAPGEVPSKRVEWGDQAYRTNTVTPLIKVG
jgi:hypothetical protein